MHDSFYAFQFKNHFILDDQIRSETIFENNPIEFDRHLDLAFGFESNLAKPVIKNLFVNRFVKPGPRLAMNVCRGLDHSLPNVVFSLI